jgi:hypothetical protein
METALLIVSLGLTGAAMLASLYLLVQAIIDASVLKKSKKNGPLKALARTAIIQEALRLAKLVLLGVVFALATTLEEGTHLALRRVLVMLVVGLIAAGSLYGGHARRSLINMVDQELERQKQRSEPVI